MNQTRIKMLASSVARAKLREVFLDDAASMTGTVQLDANGGAWVHCMVFVPPVDIEEEQASRTKDSRTKDSRTKESQ